MKLSVNWLKQFVPEFDNDEVDRIAEKMSIALTEVEDVYDISKGLENIIAGEILEIANHPTYDNIRLVNVKISEEEQLEIICGAKNIKVGNIVPVCLIGGTTYNAKSKDDEDKFLKIIEKDMGGVKSQGMLCSEKELGIGEDHSGIYLLPDQTPLGTDITTILYDTVIEIENKALTHRPDCFSHIGIAREISVQNSQRFEPPQAAQIPIQTANKEISVEVKDQVNCKRYSIIVISDVEVKDSPLWLKSRLIAAGMRPKNNIVDISNYLMLETGQPSHAYDYDKVSGHKLTLRQAKEGEEVRTLDGDKRKLNAGMLVNTDNEKIVGIAGIMGSESSEISPTTKNIIFQVENFEMFNIRRTTRELGLRTEASTRFEKGLDPNMVIEVLYKGVEMITDLAGGEIASEVIDIYPQVELPRELEFDTNLVESKLGVSVERERINEIITKLGLIILNDEKTRDTDTLLKLQIPTFRRDISIQEDILEEIIRIHGYDKLNFELPQRDLKPQNKNRRFEIEKIIKKSLVSTGSTEVFNYAFVGKDLYDKANISIEDNLKIRNPLSPELEYMRDTLLPSIIKNIEFNETRYSQIDIFEMSKTALKKIDENSGIHLQPKFITIGLSSVDDTNNKLFKVAKGKIEHIFNELGLKDIRFENINGVVPFKKANVFHPRKTALVFSKDVQIGLVGYTHPKVLSNFKIEQSMVLFELNFDLIAELVEEKTTYQKIFNLPPVRRDISFWVDEKIEIAEIQANIFSIGINYLNKINIKDIYKDQNTKDQQKSITMEITLQPENETLKEEDITSAMESVSQSLKRSFKAEIRDN